MKAFNLIKFAVCTLVCCQFGQSSAIPNTVTMYAVSGSQLAQTDGLHLLRLPMHRQTSQSQSKQTERFLNFKCKNCNGEFASSRSYDAHRLHRRARGTLCSDESSRSETTFAGRSGLATGVLRQHSLAKLGESLPFHHCAK